MQLLMGWAEVSLVPEKKVSLAGQFYERISEYVESEITVTALAVECGPEQLILMSADLTSIPEGVLALTREKFSRLCPGVSPDKLVVAATHTHTSIKMANPAAGSKGSWATIDILDEFLPEDKKYTALVTPDESVLTPEEGAELAAERIALAAARAWEVRSEAYYANEFGRAAVGMCRRVCYDDGSAQMWGDVNNANFVSLEGGNDSGIELLYIFDKNKALTGIVANIACPSQILEHRNFISADFWGRAKANLRKHFGEHIFLLGLSGAGGDQCPRDLIRWVTPETPINDPNIYRPYPLKRKADPSMFDISGCNRAGKRISNEIISVYEEITELKNDPVFYHKVLNLNLPLRKATIAQYNEAVREIEYYVDKNKDKAAFTYEDNARMHVYAGTIKRFREQQFTESFPVECHIMRLGNIAIATNPFEMFLDYGNRIKARSVAEQTFLVQLCNGKGGYLPTQKAENGGHYSAYISSGNVGHEGGDLLVRHTLAELQDLFQD